MVYGWHDASTGPVAAQRNRMGTHSVNSDAEYLVVRLGLKPHPEGGYYREVYRSLANVRLLDNPELERSAGTAAFFLLAGDDFSAFNQVLGGERTLASVCRRTARDAPHPGERSHGAIALQRP